MSSGLSIVIPSTGNLRNLKKLLPSIQHQTAGEAVIQIIIVLNGVGGDQAEHIEQFLRSYETPIEILRLSEKGVNLARNAGLAKASQSLVLFLDDDCELQFKDTLKKYIDLHRTYPDYFAIGGGYVLPDRHGRFDEVYNYIQMNWFVYGQQDVRGSIQDTKYLLGGNFCIKKELAVRYGVQFEPSIKYGGSELDFFRKAARAGLKLAASDIEVTHNTAETFFSVGKKVFKQGQGKYFIDNKFGQDDLQAPASGGRYNFLRKLYSYSFWTGYYGAQGRSWKVLGHMFRDLTGYLDVLRFQIIKKLNR